MDVQRVRDWLVVQQMPGLGVKRQQQLREHLGKVSDILAMQEDQLAKLPANIRTIFSEVQHRGDKHPFYDRANRIIDHALTSHWEIVDIESNGYPVALANIPYAPPLLFILGDASLLHEPQLAVVGARKASRMALDISYSWAKTLAGQGLVITSGLALGVDGAAHEGALATSGGQTMAVLAHGLDRLYPQAHRHLADRIVAQGALVTEFLPGAGVRRDHFPRRNRIISGLSQGVLVVEASVKSGSLITAQYAVEHNREVFAVPSSIANPMAAGCHLLIKQGAQLVESVQDIIDSFPAVEQPSLRKGSVISSESDTILDNLHDPSLKALLSLVPYEFMHVDQLIEKAARSAQEVTGLLMELQLMGVIEEQGASVRRIKPFG